MKTLLLGDSLTAWHEWQECLGPHINHAVPGETTEGLLYRLGRSLSASPERIFLMIGTNDLLQNIPMEKIRANYEQLLNELLEIEQLYILSVPPVEEASQTAGINDAIVDLNRWVREQLWKYGFVYVDLHNALAEGKGIRGEYTTDGVHLSEAGYAVCERMLGEILEEEG